MHSTSSLPCGLDLRCQVPQRFESQEPPLGQIRSILPPSRSQLDGTPITILAQLGSKHHRGASHRSDGTLLAIPPTSGRLPTHSLICRSRPTSHRPYCHLGSNHASSSPKYANRPRCFRDIVITAAGSSSLSLDADVGSRHGSNKYIFQRLLGSLIADPRSSYPSPIHRLDVEWIRFYRNSRGEARIVCRIIKDRLRRDCYRSQRRSWSLRRRHVASQDTGCRQVDSKSNEQIHQLYSFPSVKTFHFDHDESRVVLDRSYRWSVTFFWENLERNKHCKTPL